MVKEKDELINVIKEFISDVSTNRNIVTEIKAQLALNGITGGRVERILSNPEELNNADKRELALFAEQFYLKTSIQALNPDQWFTEVEMKRARQFDRRTLTEKYDKVDVVFENTSIVGNGVYVTTISVETIAELMKTQVLNYNYNIQRQAKVTKRGDSIIKKPTVYRKNVKEIKGLLVKDQLVSTTLAFNAAVGSSDSGEELTYDSSTNTLTVNEGTQLDILDGYHRCLASQEAYRDNPEIEFKFMLMISNYTEREAQQYQAQLAQATPISKTRIKELDASRYADTVVRQLKSESELRDRISSHQNISYAQGELVSYSVLSNAIEREFKMKSTRDARETSKFLSGFFDYLIGDYAEIFNNNSNQEKSLMRYNKMFAGYVALASKMMKENVEVDKLKDILDKIDFTRENNLWVELSIMNEKGEIGRRVDERKIANYFKGLEIK